MDPVRQACNTVCSSTGKTQSGVSTAESAEEDPFGEMFPGEQLETAGSVGDSRDGNEPARPRQQQRRHDSKGTHEQCGFGHM